MEQKNHEKETRVFTKEQKEKTRRRLNRLIRTRETVSRMKPREGENPTAYAERSSSESIRRRLEDQERELRRRLRKRRQEQKQERRNRRARRRQWKKQQKTETIRPSSGKTGRGSFPHAPGPAGRASGTGRLRIRPSAEAGVRSAVKESTHAVSSVGKTASRSIKTAGRSLKVTVKTAKHTAVAAKKTAQAAAKSAKMTAAATKKAGVAAVKAAIVIGKAVAAAVKAAAAAVGKVAAAIAAGGSASVVIIVLVAAVGLIAGSVYGIFLSGETSGEEDSLPKAVWEINAEYLQLLEQLKRSSGCSSTQITGGPPDWRQVLAVYAAAVAMDPKQGEEVVTMSEEKKQRLREIFGLMTEVSSSVLTEPDEQGGQRRVLQITVSALSAEAAAKKLNFTLEQEQMMSELLMEENKEIWQQLLSGSGAGETEIVAIARSQLGNAGGEPYWSWYGCEHRIEWCACFVSWCGNECGLLETGAMPKFAGCEYGRDWFQSRGCWLDGSAVPVPGMLIFFDWDHQGNSGPQDGSPDHVGIVSEVRDGKIYTIEGNRNDRCVEKEYLIGDYEIYGYGVIDK